MLLIKLARLWGWAGDRCLDVSDWHKNLARRSAALWEIAVVAAGVVLAVVIIVMGVFS
jgi:hypothetical protein